VVSGKLDVALGLRVNQYKLCVQSLSRLNSLISVCAFSTGINNRLFFWCCIKLLCGFG